MFIKGEAEEQRNNEVITLRKQWSPIWWIGVADNPVPPDSYNPGHANRQRDWMWRNWLHNFRRYVVGVAHLDRFIFGGIVSTGNAFMQPAGFLFGVTIVPSRGMIVLPYVSYRLRTNTRVYDLAIGWSRFGMFMLKARKMHPKSFDWE